MSRDANRLAVERAIRAVPRERFLPAADRALAHCDTALPIACGQTISQPSLVAYMTEQLELTAASRVLEVGTGSGYQAAILAESTGAVFTVERIEQLALDARARLGELGYHTTTTSTFASATARSAGRKRRRSMPLSSRPRPGRCLQRSCNN